MKTVIIIENQTTELKTLIGLLRRWHQEVDILTVSGYEAALTFVSRQQVDLAICDLTVPEKFALTDLVRLCQAFPHLPCIAISADKGPQPEEIVGSGARYCLVAPINPDQFLDGVHAIMAPAKTETNQGIPIHSLLQILEAEQRSCTLEVVSENGRGWLHLSEGELVDAQSGELTGEKAARQILSWQKIRPRLLDFDRQRKRTIHAKALPLIVDAFETVRDRQGEENAPEAARSHQLPLQQRSTAGKRLPLQLETTIKMVFFDLDKVIHTSVVGVVESSCLIVKNPSSPQDLRKKQGRNVLVEYLYEGRIWMFTSRLVALTEKLVPLLFLDYPKVIHFHELRKTKRAAVFIPSTFSIEGKHEMYGAMIDLSMTGSLCQIKHTRQEPHPGIELGTSLILRCLFPGLLEEQEIQAKVRNAKIEKGETRIGIEFENLDPQLTGIIENYLYSLDNGTKDGAA
ncbi:MAG: hypothetical protein CSA20_07530 [Deltaproteobacteria bacterium]|nr:MAG: hypothetical protein CSB23_00680 [Deltaproteobacteria bacterium]PIE72482.1 MAG: hypothetical protein CSA20_07530 [Deltaproteobacteria bacterium]